MTIVEVLNYIKKLVDNTSEAVVKKLVSNKYDVKFPDVQKIKGDVNVKFPDSQKIHGTVNVANMPTVQKVEVTNQKEIKFPEQKEFPKEIKISNWPKEKDFPKSIVVSNLPKQTILDTKNIEIGLDGVLKAIEKLPKKFPEPKEIKFPEQKEIIIPDEITIKNPEILIGKNPKQYIPVRLTDGEEFYEAFQSITSSLKSFFSNSEGKKKDALIDEDRHVQVDVLTVPTGGSTEAKQDTIITHLPLNDENRLKVSTLPGMPEVCSGVLTTTVAPATEIIGVGCVGGVGYIAVDVSRASNVMFSIQNTGTVNMTT